MHASVPYTPAQHALKGPFQIWNLYAYAEHTRKALMHMLMVPISSWLVCSANAAVPDLYAQHCFKGMHSVHTLVPDAYTQCTHQFLTRMLSVRISCWCACSMHASVSDAHDQCMRGFLTRMLRVYKMNIWKIWKLMRMLSMHVRNLWIWSGCASVPDAHACKEFNIFHKYLKHWKFKKIKNDTDKWYQKLHEIFFCPNSKKSPP